MREAHRLVREHRDVDGALPYLATTRGAPVPATVTRSSGSTLVELGREVVDDRTERDDVEHALAVAQQVDDLIAGLHEHGGATVEHEVRGREIGAELLAEVFDRLARGLQRDVGVEQALDDLQLDEVAVRVETLGAAAVRVAHRRAHEIGAGPVVELAVRDADDLADHAVRGIRDRGLAPPSRTAPGTAGTPPTGRPCLTRV